MGRAKVRGESGFIPAEREVRSRWSGWRRSAAALPLIALASALQTACFIEVNHVSDPHRAFRKAREEAQKVQGRSGPAHELNVLVYDSDEEKLVRVSLPIWLCRKIERNVGWGEDHAKWSEDDREEAERVRRTVKRHVRLEEIEKAGLGILAEVEDDDGSQVLIWLK